MSTWVPSFSRPFCLVSSHRSICHHPPPPRCRHQGLSATFPRDAGVFHVLALLTCSRPSTLQVDMIWANALHQCTSTHLLEIYQVYRQMRRDTGARNAFTSKPATCYWCHPSPALSAQSQFKLWMYVGICTPGSATAIIQCWRRHASLPGWLRVLSATVACLQLTSKWPTYHVYN